MCGCCGRRRRRLTLDHVDGELRLRLAAAMRRVGTVDRIRAVALGSRQRPLRRDRRRPQLRLRQRAPRGRPVLGSGPRRTGSGSASLGAVYGDVDLASGSGAVAIGLPAGVTRSPDLTTGSGGWAPSCRRRSTVAAQGRDLDQGAHRQWGHPTLPRRLSLITGSATAAASSSDRSPRGMTSTPASPATRRDAPARRRARRDVARVGAGLQPGALYAQDARLAIGLEVDPGDQRVAEQERQHVVATTLRRRRVDLDPVVEAEHPLGAVAEPDQRVERRQQRAGGHPSRPAGVGPQVRRRGPAVDRDRQQFTGVDEFGHRGFDSAEAAGSSRPGRARSPPRRRARRFAPARAGRPRARGRRGQDLGGQHPLGQVVAAARS